MNERKEEKEDIVDARLREDHRPVTWDPHRDTYIDQGTWPRHRDESRGTPRVICEPEEIGQLTLWTLREYFGSSSTSVRVSRGRIG
ncbi:hypothetical protein Sjap_014880 [Stephania japonica]|uniref:Uncharacterized protein n=1 Tax=Stephania japonica TaxID=461633 RepID=A0AAP0II76_9MAGN